MNDQSPECMEIWVTDSHVLTPQPGQALPSAKAGRQCLGGDAVRAEPARDSRPRPGYTVPCGPWAVGVRLSVGPCSGSLCPVACGSCGSCGCGGEACSRGIMHAMPSRLGPVQSVQSCSVECESEVGVGVGGMHLQCLCILAEHAESMGWGSAQPVARSFHAGSGKPALASLITHHPAHACMQPGRVNEG